LVVERAGGSPPGATAGHTLDQCGAGQVGHALCELGIDASDQRPAGLAALEAPANDLSQSASAL
jgi:hypothetical protein